MKPGRWIAVSLCMMTPVALAEGGSPHGHRGPPPEAFTACQNSSAGQDCQVPTREGNRAGKCAPRPDSQALVCRPVPPKEAVDACAGKAADDVCSVTFREHVRSGTCVSPPGESALHCRPDRPAPPPEAIAACSGKAAGDGCEVSLKDAVIRSVCAGRDQTPLHCRPERAPRHEPRLQP